MYNGKVDLHLHLDGAITETFFRKYAHKYGLVVPADLRAALSVTSGCRDLRDYLRCFSLPTQLLQWEDVLEECAYDLIRRLSAQGLLYAEIRFAPALHCRKGLSQNAAVAAVLSGIRRAKAAFPAIYINLLLCFLVGDDMHHYETLRTAAHFYGKGVAGLDLAGAEGLVPLAAYQNLFAEIREMGIPFTIHAGECGDYSNVQMAVQWGARRIGHGVAAQKSMSCMELLKERGIAVECCFSSNLQTRAVSCPQLHPIYRFYQAGIPVTVNTDNPTVSSTDLKQEHIMLRKYFAFSDQDFFQMDRYAIESAFLDRRQKNDLLYCLSFEPYQ